MLIYFFIVWFTFDQLVLWILMVFDWWSHGSFLNVVRVMLSPWMQCCHSPMIFPWYSHYIIYIYYSHIPIFSIVFFPYSHIFHPIIPIYSDVFHCISNAFPYVPFVALYSHYFHLFSNILYCTSISMIFPYVPLYSHYFPINIEWSGKPSSISSRLPRSKLSHRRRMRRLELLNAWEFRFEDLQAACDGAAGQRWLRDLMSLNGTYYKVMGIHW